MIRRVERTGSTNADLLEAARRGERGPTVLVTDHQTAGRGRQDRRWQDDPGASLLVSYLVEIDRTRAPLLPLVAGLAAVGVGDELVGLGVLGLKWPNDVLVANTEAKVAGILVESVWSASSIRAVVGMGMNLASAPAPGGAGLGALVRERSAPAHTDGDELAAPVVPSRDEVLEHYLAATERWLARLEADGGPTSILDAYRRCCVTVGRSVRFRDGVGDRAEVIEGRAMAIDDSGHLVVEDGAGRTHVVSAGDAHLL